MNPYGHLAGTPQRNEKKYCNFPCCPTFLMFLPCWRLVTPVVPYSFKYFWVSWFFYCFWWILLFFDGFWWFLMGFGALFRCIIIYIGRAPEPKFLLFVWQNSTRTSGNVLNTFRGGISSSAKCVRSFSLSRDFFPSTLGLRQRTPKSPLIWVHFLIRVHRSSKTPQNFLGKPERTVLCSNMRVAVRMWKPHGRAWAPLH